VVLQSLHVSKRAEQVRRSVLCAAMALQRAGADRQVKGESARNPAWLDKKDPRPSKSQPLAKVKRWRAGQAPSWATDAAPDSDKKDASAPSRRPDAAEARSAPVAEEVQRKSATEALSEHLQSGSDVSHPDSEQKRQLARERARARALQATQQEEDDDELASLPADEGMLEQTRHRHLAAAAASASTSATHKDATLIGTERYEDESENDDAGDEESEEDESSDEDEEDDVALARPMFVPKDKRATKHERELAQQETEDVEKREEERRERLRQQSKQLIEQEREALAQEADEAEKRTPAEAATRESDIDTDDEKDEHEQYEEWKLRELNRLRREREARQGKPEDEETRRMRQMDEEEKNEEAAKRAVQPGSQRKNSKAMFMQKYYHKGAFFQADADDVGGTAGTHEILHKRDFSEATGEDRVDKTMLPEPMRVRKGNFGLKNQSKWTHLANEDTTLKAREGSLASEKGSVVPEGKKNARVKGEEGLDKARGSKKKQGQ